MTPKSKPKFDLTESVGYLINHAAWAARMAFETELANFDITAPQWSVLVRLWEEDNQAPSEICRRLFFDRPTMTGIIDRMESRGLVHRKRDESDRRVIRIQLTKKGKDLQKKLPSVAMGVDAHTLEGLAPDEIEVFLRCLKKVVTNFSPQPIKDHI